MIDRSPCGTGTCAVMAALHARGEMAVGDELVHEGILGTTFVGKLVGEAEVGAGGDDAVRGVVPTVTGRVDHAARDGRFGSDGSVPGRLYGGRYLVIRLDLCGASGSSAQLAGRTARRSRELMTALLAAPLASLYDGPTNVVQFAISPSFPARRRPSQSSFSLAGAATAARLRRPGRTLRNARAR